MSNVSYALWAGPGASCHKLNPTLGHLSEKSLSTPQVEIKFILWNKILYIIDTLPRNFQVDPLSNLFVSAVAASWLLLLRQSYHSEIAFVILVIVLYFFNGWSVESEGLYDHILGWLWNYVCWWCLELKSRLIY